MRDDEPRYVISVAAELAGLHPQTLRQYDRLGLVTPRRAVGRGRRYSARDVERLREVARLTRDDGVNLAGVRRILELEERVDQLERAVQLLLVRSEPGRRVFAAATSGEMTIVPRGRRAQPPDRVPPAGDDARALVPWHRPPRH